MTSTSVVPRTAYGVAFQSITETPMTEVAPAEKQIFPFLLQVAEDTSLLSSKCYLGKIQLFKMKFEDLQNTLRRIRFQSSSLRSVTDLSILCKQISLWLSSH